MTLQQLLRVVDFSKDDASVFGLVWARGESVWWALFVFFVGFVGCLLFFCVVFVGFWLFVLRIFGLLGTKVVFLCVGLGMFRVCFVVCPNCLVLLVLSCTFGGSDHVVFVLYVYFCLPL